MSKIYGKKGKSVKTSELYDTTTILQTFILEKGNTKGTLLASGTWNGIVFWLHEDACIKKNFDAKTAKGGNEIIKELIEDGAFKDFTIDDEYYILNKNIALHSPTSAANLVHGNDRNGQECWENDGKTLSDLNVI